MKPNSGLIGTDGYQVCLYPLPVLIINQTSGADSFSHCCGSPFDAGGSTKKATLYAPCDCTLYYRGEDASGNTCSFTSDKKVITPSGLKYVSFQFTHGDLLGNGKTYKQGQPIYTTGTKGFATGDHVHIDQALKAKADFIFSGIVCGGGNQCWMLDGSTSATNVFYINDTDIITTLGLNFKTYKGGIPTTSPDDTGEILNWIIPVVESAPFERSIKLTDEQEKNNARCFYGVMHNKGWSLQAIAGILGNIQGESGCNPNTWQGDYKYYNPVELEGFGLVQWTPYTNITDWLEKKGAWGNFSEYGNLQCEKIEEEVFDENPATKQWWEKPPYLMTFPEFKTSTQDPGYLAMAFQANYERPQVLHGEREQWARDWYNYLKQFPPVLPGTSDGGMRPKSRKTKWIYYLKKRK